jgi:hypothetical protein
MALTPAQVIAYARAAALKRASSAEVAAVKAVVDAEAVKTSALGTGQTAIKGASFDTATDALEKIRDQQTLMQGGVETLESIKTDIEQVLDLAVASASTTMTGAALTLLEFVPTVPSYFDGGAMDLTNLAAGDTVVVKIYRKIKSGGNYIQESIGSVFTFTGAQTEPLKEISGRPVRYGIKITIQQTAGTNRVIDNIWFTAAPGV